MTSRPNIILLVCDQMRAFDVGCYGHPLVQTPNIDRLAAHGVRFETAVSNNAVCTPARSTMLSGQYSRTCNGWTGCSGNYGERRNQFPDKTIAEVCREAGYETASIGKWHMPSPPASVGFDTYINPVVPHWHSEREYSDNARPDGYTVDEWTWEYDLKRLHGWLDERDEARPFFLYYNIEPPHMPLDDVPERYKALYDPGEVPIRDNAFVAGDLAYDEHWFKIYLWDYRYYLEHRPEYAEPPADFDLRTLTAMYLGMITLVDDLVGRFVDELESRGLLKNSLLVFTSDHGDNLGSHGNWNKCMLWEESIRIPMIWHWPGALKPAAIERQIASLVDLMPTLLGLTALPCPAAVQGTDLSPVLRGEATTVGDNVAYIESIQDGVGLRTLTHKVGIAIENHSLYEHKPEHDTVTDERHIAFDLESDPYELSNLAKSGMECERMAELRAQLLQWHRQTPWMHEHSS